MPVFKHPQQKNTLARGEVRTSIKGRTIPFAQIVAENEEAPAIGNMNVNARGDLLGAGGKIIMTKADLNAKYYEKNPQAVKRTTLEPLKPDTFLTPGELSEKVRAEQATKAAEKVIESPVKKVRKLSDE